MFNKNVAAITKQFAVLVGKLEEVEVNSTRKITDAQALIRAGEEYIKEQEAEKAQAVKIAANIKKLIGE